MAYIKWASIEANIKRKIDFFFKPLAQSSDMKENFRMLSNFEPIYFENPSIPWLNNEEEGEEKYFHKKATDKWIGLSKTIFKKDNRRFRKMLFTMNGDMYHQLKDLAKNLSGNIKKRKPSITKSIHQSNKSTGSSYMKEGIDMLDQIISNDEEEQKKDESSLNNLRRMNNFKINRQQSIITPLMMLKRGQVKLKGYSDKNSKRLASLETSSESKIKNSKVKLAEFILFICIKLSYYLLV